MELTAPRFLLAALPAFLLVLVTVPSASEAQRIVSFPSTSGQETKDFPRRKELLQALDFLEEYGRGRENDWNDGESELDNGAFYGDDETDIVYPDDANEIYPALDFADILRQPDEDSVEEDDNEVDGLPWMGDDGRYAGQHLTEGQERLEDMLQNYDYEELLDIALQEAEIEEDEALRDALEREEEEILDIVEEEMENIAMDNILEDLWAEEELQEDAENQLKWLLQEEEEKELREEEDPFEYFYPDEAEPGDITDEGGQDDDFPGDMDEGMESAYADYSEGISVDYMGESLDGEEEEDEELLEEAVEILNLAEQGYEEDDEEKKLLAEKLLQGIIGDLTKENEDQEEVYAPSYAEEEEIKDEEQSSSVLDAGMVDEESADETGEKEQEVYDELLELVDDEIDKVIENIADDMLELEKEELETGGSSDEAEGDYDDEEEDDTSSETSIAEEEILDDTSEGSEFALDDDEECPSLQYFVDDCNIVNNYADLGADGYKGLFTGACNRHQLCYTCGSYYDVDAKLCDELFKAEILSRCPSKDTDCKQRAKYFWLVARNNRVYVPDSPSVCGDPCLLEFLVQV